jgi:transcriptional regulator with XRE-family HTH domain
MLRLVKNNVNPEMLVLAREVRGLTQPELAELSGINQLAISHYESCEKPIPTDAIEAFSRSLGFPVEWFYQKGSIHPSMCYRSSDV